MTQSRKWVLGTAVLAALILIVTWLLVVTPRMTEARDTRDATEDALARQDQLRTELARLEAQYADIDEYRAELAQLRTQIPEAPELADYVRQLHDMATQHGVTLVTLAPGVPTSFIQLLGVSAAPPTPAPTEEETDGESDAESDEAVDEAEETAQDASGAAAVTDTTSGAIPASMNALVAVPISMTVVGTYPATSAFLEAVQVQLPRLFLVGAFSALSLDTADSSNGRPATAPGDVELTIEGMVYSYPSEQVVEAEDGEEATDVPAQLPATDRNPYAPVTG